MPSGPLLPETCTRPVGCSRLAGRMRFARPCSSSVPLTLARPAGLADSWRRLRRSASKDGQTTKTKKEEQAAKTARQGRHTWCGSCGALGAPWISPVCAFRVTPVGRAGLTAASMFEWRCNASCLWRWASTKRGYGAARGERVRGDRGDRARDDWPRGDRDLAGDSERCLWPCTQSAARSARFSSRAYPISSAIVATCSPCPGGALPGAFVCLLRLRRNGCFTCGAPGAAATSRGCVDRGSRRSGGRGGGRLLSSALPGEKRPLACASRKLAPRRLASMLLVRQSGSSHPACAPARAGPLAEPGLPGCTISGARARRDPPRQLVHTPAIQDGRINGRGARLQVMNFETGSLGRASSEVREVLIRAC